MKKELDYQKWQELLNSQDRIGSVITYSSAGSGAFVGFCDICTLINGSRKIISLYFDNRSNGVEKDDPCRPFPEDGEFSYVTTEGYQADGRSRTYQTFMYVPGPKDIAWMKEKDRNYVLRLEREGRLDREEPNIKTDAPELYEEVMAVRRAKEEKNQEEAKVKQEQQKQQERIKSFLYKNSTSFMPVKAVPDDIDIPEFMCCPISGLIMIDPVSNAQNQTYEREAIEAWLNDHDTDPNTNQKLPNKTLNENVFARQAIQPFLDSHPELKNSQATYFPKQQLVDFMLAIELSAIDKVKTLIQKDRRVLTYYFTEDRTPLHYAAENGTPQILEYILSKQSADEISAIKKLPKPAEWIPTVLNERLFNAAGQGDVATVQEMFALGAELEGQNKDQKTALCIAAEAGKQSVVELLLLRGANISARDSEHNAPLDLALLNNHDDVVSSLLDYGIPDYEPVDERDRTLLSYNSLFYVHKKLSPETIKPAALKKKAKTVIKKKTVQTQGQFFKPEKPETEDQTAKAPEWTAMVPPRKK